MRSGRKKARRQKVTGAAQAQASSDGCPPTLREWLSSEPYAIGLAPAFFGFYAQIGALTALEEAGIISVPEHISFVSGASAGALVGGMLAAGMKPSEMGEKVFAFKRNDFWDMGVGLGLLKGHAFERIIESMLPVKTFDSCISPLGVSAYDILTFSMKSITHGNLAPALRASATFPGLFQPVSHDQGFLIDGGIKDVAGLWCIPDEGERHRRVLHVSLGGGVEMEEDPVIVAPSEFPAKGSVRCSNGPGKEIVSLCLNGLPPRPHPFNMNDRGRLSMDAAYEIVKACLDEPLTPGKEKGHWVVNISTAGTKRRSELTTPIPAVRSQKRSKR